MDPLEREIMEREVDNNEDVILGERIMHVEASDTWSLWRDNLTTQVFNAQKARA